MKTWEEYKNYVKSKNEKERWQMEEIEEVADHVSLAIKRGQELRINQRVLVENAGVIKSLK